MDKKQSTTTTTTNSHPLGMCEKIFNAFQPSLRPLRRLTFRHQELEPANYADSAHPIDQTKLAEPIAPPQVQQTHNPKTKLKLLPSPSTPPKLGVVPIGKVPQPLQPPKSEKVTKKGINEKVDEYIARTKGKIKSTVSSVGKVAGSK